MLRRFNKYTPYIARQHEFDSVISKKYEFGFQCKFRGLEQYLVISKECPILFIPKDNVNNNNINELGFDVVLDVLYIPEHKLILIYDLLFYKGFEICCEQPYHARLNLCIGICDYVQGMIREKIKIANYVIYTGEKNTLAQYAFNRLEAAEKDVAVNLLPQFEALPIKLFLEKNELPGDLVIVGTCLKYINFMYEYDLDSCFGNYVYLREYKLSVMCGKNGICVAQNRLFQLFLAHLWAQPELWLNSGEDASIFFDDFTTYHLQLPFVYNDILYDSYYELIDRCPELVNKYVSWFCYPSDEYFRIELSGSQQLDSHDVALHKYLTAKYFYEECIIPNEEIKKMRIDFGKVEPEIGSICELHYQFPNPQRKHLSLADTKEYLQLSKKLNSYKYLNYIKRLKTTMHARQLSLEMDVPFISNHHFQNLVYSTNSYSFETKIHKIYTSRKHFTKTSHPFCNYRVQVYRPANNYRKQKFPMVFIQTDRRDNLMIISLYYNGAEDFNPNDVFLTLN